MKRKTFSLFAASLLLISGIFCYTIFFSYQPSEEVSDFPVPKKAELIEANRHARTYNWAPASEENGIPFGYKIVLKVNGWEEQEREGASVIYTKGDKQVDVISQTQLLILRDME
ncbi:hypothetical protein [Planomicrobium sp. CPCC 101110]|uniref:hypothetical protein n=1 Tax=Planomicrobium sp. CPCC 101110 TaxID=2599619 RepID=UPI0011B77764|nr:hypothetical protein [Planomicrobium sp. CPCC 101110]TWT27214.1 hypothetical protein FQV30_01470 [Planomicrobium sp. CPCC 101110]